MGLAKTANMPTEDGLSGFERLPLELHTQIWKHACPELFNTTLMFDFAVGPTQANDQEYTVYDMGHLRSATEGIRTALAVHRRSRHLALEELPDVLCFRSLNVRQSLVGEVRLKRGRDLVFLQHFHPPRGQDGVIKRVNYVLPSFGDVVENVVVSGREVNTEDRRCLNFLLSLTSVKKVYYSEGSSRKHGHNMSPSWSWFSSPACHQRQRHMDNQSSIYCWPTRASESPMRNIPRKLARWEFGLQEPARARGWALLPMAVFTRKGNPLLSDMEILWGDVERHVTEPGVPVDDGASDFSSEEEPTMMYHQGTPPDTRESTPWWDVMAAWAQGTDAAERARWVKRTEMAAWGRWCEYAAEGERRRAAARAAHLRFSRMRREAMGDREAEREAAEAATRMAQEARLARILRSL